MCKAHCSVVARLKQNPKTEGVDHETLPHQRRYARPRCEHQILLSDIQQAARIQFPLRLVGDMTQEPFNVLFLCTGNSARSIMAEAILNGLGRGKFKAFSAGSRPVGRVNPLALALLEKNRLPMQGLRSKDWSEFSRPGAPFMHFVFTVCDQAAAETCPVWPGQPMTAHWGVPDPAAVEGNEETRQKAFVKAYTELYRRISLFTALPFEKLDKLALKAKLDEIGRAH
jgi:arsenate reductase (thioredoxin)